MQVLKPILLALALCAGATGCQRPLHADAPVLAGAIPRCAVLLSEARTQYRDTAKQECEANPDSAAACTIVQYTKDCTEWQ